VIDDLYVNADVVMACVDLAARTGASGFELGHVHDDVPVEEAFRRIRGYARDHRRSLVDVAADIVQRRLTL